MSNLQQSEDNQDNKFIIKRPTRAEAEAAVRTLIAWAGDNPDREGLIETPKRVVEAYQEFFSGYEEDPKKILGKTFEEVENYNDIVLLKDMSFESHCEHHLVPIIGVAHIAYIPNQKVVGISKIARLLKAFAKRLQTQEVMTNQIVDAIVKHLDPLGVAIIIDAKHQCMTTRGVYNATTKTITKRVTGLFREDSKLEDRFIALVNNKSSY